MNRNIRKPTNNFNVRAANASQLISDAGNKNRQVRRKTLILPVKTPETPVPQTGLNNPETSDFVSNHQQSDKENPHMKNRSHLVYNTCSCRSLKGTVQHLSVHMFHFHLC